jgi:hypothetical protein
VVRVVSNQSNEQFRFGASLKRQGPLQACPGCVRYTRCIDNPLRNSTSLLIFANSVSQWAALELASWSSIATHRARAGIKHRLQI